VIGPSAARKSHHGRYSYNCASVNKPRRFGSTHAPRSAGRSLRARFSVVTSRPIGAVSGTSGRRKRACFNYAVVPGLICICWYKFALSGCPLLPILHLHIQSEPTPRNPYLRTRHTLIASLHRTGSCGMSLLGLGPCPAHLICQGCRELTATPRGRCWPASSSTSWRPYW
jgi:hypothetical protein